MTDNGNRADAEIDARLSEWGRAVRAAAPPVAVPASLMTAAGPAHRRTVLLRVCAGVAMAAIVLATVIGLPRYLPRDRLATPSIGGVTSTATARPGFQVVTFHGLSITVPSSWLLNEAEPCKLSREVVLLPVGVRTLCGFPDTPSVAFVEFLGADTPLGLTGPLKVTKTRISGLAGTRTDGVWVARPAFGYTVPTLRASVRIVPALGQTGAELAGSLEVNAFDSHGCPAAVSDAAELPRDKPPARAGAADTLVPGRPDVLRVCRYYAGRLEQGADLTGPQASELITVLDHLPAGLSRAAAGTYWPPLCETSSRGSNMVGGDDAEAYRIEADYPTGNPVIVIVRLGLCGDLGASNGSRTGQRTDALWEALFALVSNREGVSAVTAVP